MHQPVRKSDFTPLHATGLHHLGDSHFQRLMEKLPAAAYTCDADGLITFFNRHAVDRDARSATLEAGFDHHLVKPVDLHELDALLKRTANEPGKNEALR